MKRVIFYSILLLSIFSCNEKIETNSERQDKMKDENLKAQEAISNINKQAERWYRDKQADSLITIMADNVIQFPPNNKPLMGKDSIRNYWSQLFQFGELDFSIQTQEVNANGTLAIERGKYGLKFTPKQNSPIPAFADTGNYLAYWQKVNDNWKIVWDAPVSSLPLPSK